MPLFSARSGVMKQFDAPESNKTWDSKPPTNKVITTHALRTSQFYHRQKEQGGTTNPQPAAEQPAALCCTSATGGTPGAPVEPLAENEPITASANPPLSHQDPEPEHHPNPEQPRSQTNTRIHTGLTRHGYRLGHRRSRHTRRTLSPESAEVHNPWPRPPRPLALPPRPRAPRPLAPQPLATRPSHSWNRKEHTRTQPKLKTNINSPRNLL
ncbi:unnamed protein product [Microthlaspi erraticum]|uniref:Uncharacterized protein n=1 Tax=Microthlaspi erraticum TaxID=1685480 RepID=A0A6D2HUC0_9BRAS|nr:unnamed protein product [Microthlaspi erraticum]